jgi:hypothetical protein
MGLGDLLGRNEPGFEPAITKSASDNTCHCGRNLKFRQDLRYNYDNHINHQLF